MLTKLFADRRSMNVRRPWRHVTRGTGNESDDESKGHDRNVDDHDQSARCASTSRRLRLVGKSAGRSLAKVLTILITVER